MSLVGVCVCAAEWAAVTGGCHWLPLRVCPTECRAVFACKYPATEGRLATAKILYRYYIVPWIDPE